MTRFVRAWQTHAKATKFFGKTLPEFKTAIQDSFDTREQIVDLQRQLRTAISRRNIADRRTMRLMRGAAFSVMADPDHGEDSILYEAMGYVRKSVRRKRRRKAK